jgi:hypothetical protein
MFNGNISFDVNRPNMKVECRAMMQVNLDHIDIGPKQLLLWKLSAFQFEACVTDDD